MEIIHLILGKANPDRLNGVNKVVYNLATEQSKAGKNVSVWGISPNPVHDYPERNFKTRLFQAKKNPFQIDSALKEAIIFHKKAVFHLHGGWIPVFSSVAKILAKYDIRYVLTPHGAYNTLAMRQNYWLKKLYFYCFEKKLLQHTHKVHAIGKSEVEGLKILYPKATSFLMPYGFPLSPQTNIPPKNEDFTICFLGRLDTHTKGLDLLMQAFFQFQQKHPPAQLWFIGEGEGKIFLEDFIAKNKVPNVHLWGKKFGEEKEALVAKSHIFVHPSRNEGLPTAVLEAAALGLAVIVTQATNVAEYVQDYKAGIAIADEDSAALLAAMERLWEENERGNLEQYALGATKMLEEVFNWSVLVQKFDTLYS